MEIHSSYLVLPDKFNIKVDNEVTELPDDHLVSVLNNYENFVDLTVIKIKKQREEKLINLIIEETPDVLKNIVSHTLESYSSGGISANCTVKMLKNQFKVIGGIDKYLERIYKKLYE